MQATARHAWDWLYTNISPNATHTTAEHNVRHFRGEAKEELLDDEADMVAIPLLHLSPTHDASANTSPRVPHNNRFHLPQTPPQTAANHLSVSVDSPEAHTPPSPAEKPSRAPNWMAVTLVSLAVIVTLSVILYLLRDYVRQFLLWVEDQPLGVSLSAFLLSFVVVSLPVSWGYILLNLAAGYLYGVWYGLVVVMVSVAVGVIVSHYTTRFLWTAWVRTRVAADTTLTSILAVLDGTRGLKVVVLARLTPIPFGMQNAVFALGKLNIIPYVAASTLGLIPTQLINAYLGSTLRSMEDVLEDAESAKWGYLVFFVQIVFSVVLMLFILRQARRELSRTVGDNSSPS